MSKKRVRAPDWKEMRRYRALELKRDEWTLEEIAEALDVSTRSVTTIYNAFPLHRSLSLSTGVYSGLPGPIYRDCRVMITAYY
jgi:Homeodomain-like domain-containing protein